MVGSSQNPASSGSSLDATLSSLSLIGSSEIPIGGPFLSSNPEYPLATTPIDGPARIVRVERTPGERLERWTIASPSMQREVSVQIYRGADENVTLVMPTQAAGS